MIGPILGGLVPQKYTPTGIKMICDGNSLVHGYGSTTGNDFPSQLGRLAPINSQFNVANTGANGINIQTMRNNGPTNIDANYNAGKTNILFAWEGTNTAWQNASLTGTEIAQQMEAYCQERLDAHSDWKIILLTTLPRFNTDGAYGADLAAGNATLIEYNDYLKANYRSMGAKMVVDVRAAGIFTYTGTAMPAAMQPYMYDLIHCNDDGYGLIAKYCADALRRLPAR